MTFVVKAEAITDALRTTTLHAGVRRFVGMLVEPLELRAVQVTARLTDLTQRCVTVGGEKGALFTVACNDLVRLRPSQHPLTTTLKLGTPRELLQRGLKKLVIYPTRIGEFANSFRVQLREGGGTCNAPQFVDLSFEGEWLDRLASEEPLPDWRTSRTSTLLRVVWLVPLAGLDQTVKVIFGDPNFRLELSKDQSTPIPLTVSGVQRSGSVANFSRNEGVELMMSVREAEGRHPALESERSICCEIVLGSLLLNTEEVLSLRPGISLEIQIEESIPVTLQIGGRSVGRAKVNVGSEGLSLEVVEMI